MDVTDLARCDWAYGEPELLGYHDDEWGRPVRTDRGLYERIVLEGFLSGLSWITILRKRENFRRAFAGFDFSAVAEFGDVDRQRLLGDAGIVRNRRKIEAAITNARAVLDAVPEGLTELLWSFVPATHARPVESSAVPATSPESAAMAKELKRRGFVFVGPTTSYALMQATGIVDDHISTCFRAAS